MSGTRGNGIVELVDEKRDYDSGFFCMDLVSFITSEGEESGDKSWEFWHDRFEQAKAGCCPYRGKCPRFAQTMSRPRKPVQLKMF